MASRWKTFQPNEILPAADVNDVLNPTTADHIPVAVAAGRRSQAVGTTAFSVTVPFPAGRFTVAPVVTVSPEDTYPGAVSVSATGISTSGFTLRIERAASATTIVNWIAVQM